MAATSAEPEQPTDPAPAAEEPAPAAEEEQATAAGTAGTKTPLRQRIGLVKPRHERDVWKAKAEAPVALQAKDRNAEMDIKILCGMIDDAVRESVLCKETRIVCFLLSSTFTDTVLLAFIIDTLECANGPDKK